MAALLIALLSPFVGSRIDRGSDAKRWVLAASLPFMLACAGLWFAAPAEWERIVTEMQIVAERMVRGEYSPETAAAEIDRRADRLLEKRRWMMEQGRAV